LYGARIERIPRTSFSASLAPSEEHGFVIAV